MRALRALVLLTAVLVLSTGCSKDRLPTPQTNPPPRPSSTTASPLTLPEDRSPAATPAVLPSFCAPLARARESTGELGLDPTKPATGLAEVAASYDEAARRAPAELREALESFAAALRDPADRLAYDRAQFFLEDSSSEIEELCGAGSLSWTRRHTVS